MNGVRVDAVRGLAPRTCEGGVPALAQGRGEHEFPPAKRQIMDLSVFTALFFTRICERHAVDALPPPPVCELVAPPS